MAWPPGRRCPARARRRARGHAFLFTLLLVALLSVTLLVAAELDSTLARRERERALLQVGHEFRQALARYQTGRAGVAAGQYPPRLEDLLLDPRYPYPVRHLRRVPPDPITGRAEWGLVVLNGRIVGLHSLSTGTPLKQDGFDPDDSGLRRAGSYRDWVFSYPPGRALGPAADAASAPAAGFAPRPVAPAASQR